MTRALVPFGTAAAVFALGNALAAHDYLTAAAAGVLAIVGILLLSPASLEVPAPARAAKDNARATGEGL